MIFHDMNKLTKKMEVFVAAVWASLLIVILFSSSAFAYQGSSADELLLDKQLMQAELSDDELSGVSGQALFWSDTIKGSELTGANEYSTPFNFYRVGLDGELALNLNIAKAQLGCGGVNDFLNAKAGCDIDIDFAALMGRTGVNVGNPLSAFVLKRPYIEIAIKNDLNAATREVVGLKIGAQSADGAITAGRRYLPGQVNQENMFARNCSTATVGLGALGCHSGINSVSGFLGAEMSLSMGVRARITALIIPVTLTAMGCVGATTYSGRGESCAPHNPVTGVRSPDALFIDLAGSRMDSMGLTDAKLKLSDVSAGGLNVSGLMNSAYASLKADLRLVHKMILENTNDFFISFQREPVAYPRYSKMTPYAEMTQPGMPALNTVKDACAVTAYQSPRCFSAYAVPANTGWWLNLPTVKLLDVYTPEANLGTVGSLGDVLALLGAPGLQINQGEFNLTPGKNCYGSTRFC